MQVSTEMKVKIQGSTECKIEVITDSIMALQKAIMSKLMWQTSRKIPKRMMSGNAAKTFMIKPVLI